MAAHVRIKVMGKWPTIRIWQEDDAKHGYRWYWAMHATNDECIMRCGHAYPNKAALCDGIDQAISSLITTNYRIEYAKTKLDAKVKNLAKTSKTVHAPIRRNRRISRSR